MPLPRPIEHDSHRPGARQVENYTTPFLIVSGVLCYVGLLVLWAVFGLPATLFSAYLADRLISRC